MSGISDIIAPIILLIIVYFLVFFPASRKKRKQRRMIEGLRAGDVVITVAGIQGTVVTKSEKHITLEIAPGVRVEVEKTKVESKTDRTKGLQEKQVTTSRRCPGCGASFKNGDRFCGQCGASLPG